jgi:eukaryotic-like serine/threonine-protein kinase
MPRILDVEKVGSFKVIEKIGEGGMAIIYKASQPSLNRTVVIKKLKDPNNEIIERFKKEALVSASLSQENVLSIYDFIYHGRSYYLIMEYVDGFDMHDILDYMSPLSPVISSLLIREIAKGLEYTHNKNVIHRDIKPSNILISKEGDVKLIDFGVAKDEAPSKLTITGMIIGTPSYMSPEQANGEKINHQSDIYSLGVLFYEILTGFKPYSGDTNTEIFAKISKGKFASPMKYRSDIPLKLVKIIKKCLHKNRDKRYKNATELIRDINKYLPLQVQTHDKNFISDFIKHYEKVEQTATIHSNLYKTVKPIATWASIITLIVLFFFALININRFFVSERFSNLSIESNSQNFSVMLDGNSVKTSNTGKVQISNILPGNHELEVTGIDKYGVYSSNLYLEPAEKKYQKVILPEKNNTVNLSISTIPFESDVFFNNRFIGKSPIEKLTLSSGKQNITIKKSGYQELTIQKELLSEQSYNLNYSLIPKNE